MTDAKMRPAAAEAGRGATWESGDVVTRRVELRGGPYDGKPITLDGYVVKMPDPVEQDPSGPIPVHTYSLRRDEDGTFYGRYDGMVRV